MIFDFRNCEENIESVVRIYIIEYDNDYGKLEYFIWGDVI